MADLMKGLSETPSSAQAEDDKRVFFKADNVSSLLIVLSAIGMILVVILSIATVNTFGQFSFILFSAAAAGGLILTGTAKCIQYLYEVKQIMTKPENPNPIRQRNKTFPSVAPKQKAILKKDGLSVALIILGIVGTILVIALTIRTADDLGAFAFVLFGAAVTNGLLLIGIAKCIQHLYEIRQLLLEREEHQTDKNDKS